MIFLGAFATLGKVTIIIMSVRPPAWNNSATAEWVCVKFYAGVFLLKYIEKIHTWL